MTQTPLMTMWKFVVEFQDDDTKEISGTIGQAGTREECEGLIEHDQQYHRSHERTVLHTEAVEVCAKCEGVGEIPAGNGRRVICDACGGRLGPLSKLTSSSLITTNVNGRLLGHFPGLGRNQVRLRPVEPEFFR